MDKLFLVSLVISVFVASEVCILSIWDGDDKIRKEAYNPDLKLHRLVGI